MTESSSNPSPRRSASVHSNVQHPPLPGYAVSNRRGSHMPTNEDRGLSTRGQRLPQLLQARAHESYGRHGSRPEYHHNDSDVDLERGSSIRSGVDAHRNEARENRISGDGRGIDMDQGFDAPEFQLPAPPSDFPLTRVSSLTAERVERRSSVLMTPQMRSQRLIGNSNPRYRWEQYYKTEEELKEMKKPLRAYYERNNYLIMQYLYIDRLLDSSLPHNLIQEYNTGAVNVPDTIHEEGGSSPSPLDASETFASSPTTSGRLNGDASAQPQKVNRTKDLYKVPDERTPLISSQQDGVDKDDDTSSDEAANIPAFQPDEETDSSAPVVTFAIYLNLAANTILLILKIIVTVLTSSLSVLASLVDAVLDFLSTAIVWTTTRLISRGSTDQENFPVGRRRLEPIGVLVFSVVMITSFFQVALEAIQRLTGPDHSIVRLSYPAIAIMLSTVVVKAICWLWCRLIRNSAVQALAQDAVTDVVFNTFSIIFPLVGYYTSTWWLDPLGGLLLSLYVIISWAFTSRTHILNLTGQAASADERNILLYLTMRFAHTIKRIQSLQAYHAGDKLNVEVDIVLDEGMSLRDSHDLGESLQYVLESVPGVERAFVHADYWEGNLPSHMRQ